MSKHEVVINGHTYYPATRRFNGPDIEYANAVMNAPVGSDEREAGLAHFGKLYRVEELHGFQGDDIERGRRKLAAEFGVTYEPGDADKVRRIAFQIVRSLAKRARRIEVDRWELYMHRAHVDRVVARGNAA